MKKTLCLVLSIILLGTSLGGCIYDIDDESAPSLALVAVRYSADGTEDLVCAEQGFLLVAFDILGDGPWYQWYKDGQPLGAPSQAWLGESGPRMAFYPPVPLEMLGPDDLPELLTAPGRYSVRFWMETDKEYQELTVVVPSCQVGSTRADVSVVIYGGWDGIPVKAYVAGTEQETLYTARDASGEAAVLWTFYPPAGQAWDVSIEPQTPPGKDPARWQYKLLRIEGPTPGQVVDSPAGASVSVSPSGQYTLYFQLLDTKPQVAQ